jgi:hypothetical protein
MSLKNEMIFHPSQQSPRTAPYTVTGAEENPGEPLPVPVQ